MKYYERANDITEKEIVDLYAMMKLEDVDRELAKIHQIPIYMAKSKIREIIDTHNLPIPKKFPKEVREKIRNTIISKSKEEKELIEKKKKETISKWSEEEKEAYHLSMVSARDWWSNSMWEDSISSFLQTMSNKTQEEKETIHNNRSNATKNYFNSMSDEERVNFSNKMSSVYNDLSEDKKRLRGERISSSYKKTCINKYGVENAMLLSSVKKKVQDTNMRLYGVENYCQSKNCRLKGNDSKPNKLFNDLLIKNVECYNPLTDREFSLGRYSYDFKVGKILIEINPYATHNSTWSPFKEVKPKDKYYHYSKSKFAEDNGYHCINVWDWDDFVNVVNMLKNPNTIVFTDFEEPTKHCFNIKTREHFIVEENYVEGENEVVIYDSGQKYLVINTD